MLEKFEGFVGRGRKKVRRERCDMWDVVDDVSCNIKH